MSARDEVLANIEASAELLRAEAVESDRIGRLTEKSIRAVVDSGVIRLLQSKEFGGYEAHPADFAEAVMAVGKASPSAGWVSGVVGVHPWQVAIMDPRLQEEIYGPGGSRRDTLTASPYAPFGRATKVDGGFRYSGRWPYSTGSDHVGWFILGGLVVDESAPAGPPVGPPDIRHFVLPKADVQILPDTWNVSGLRGTGSNDVQVADVFVPDYRVMEYGPLLGGAYDDRHPNKALYSLRFTSVFGLAIVAGLLGIAEGALDVYREYLKTRVNVYGSAARKDPIQLNTYAEVAADLEASRLQILSDIREAYDYTSRGGEMGLDKRVRLRRNHVRAAHRAADGIVRLYNQSGSAAIRQDLPLGRYYDDLRAGLQHIFNVAEPVQVGWGQLDLTGEIDPTLNV